MLIHWIWFATRQGLSDRGRAIMLQHFRDAEDIYFADGEAYSICQGLSETAVTSLQDKDLRDAEKILGQCARKNIHIMTYRDAAYPARLKAIADPPAVLYYKGRLLDFDNLPLIGVVGTRKATAYGLTAAKRLGSEISACGGVIVSGVASGIDGMAMRGALSAGAPVIGVLGCGADVVYPKSNRALYADTENQGCLLTEFPPGTEPLGWNFPKRNRIISGLSCGVLVVEAPEKSGALSTANHAADQGRDVFVVPGNIDVPTCAGSNALLRCGGIAASCGWDVIGEYEAQFPDKIQNCHKLSSQIAYQDEVKKACIEAEKPIAKVAQTPQMPKKQKSGEKKEIDNPDASRYIDAEKTLPALSEDEQKLVTILRGGITQVDEIIAESALPAGKVLAVLTMLEVKGVIKRLPGKRVEMK